MEPTSRNKRTNCKARLTLAFQDSCLRFELSDDSSSILIFSAEIPPEQVMKLMSGLNDVKVAGVMGNKDLFGKEMEVSKMTFPFPQDLDQHNPDYELLYQAACAAAEEGWEPDKHFRSQASFFYNEDSVFSVRVTVRRWLEKECMG